MTGLSVADPTLSLNVTFHIKCVKTTDHYQYPRTPNPVGLRGPVNRLIIQIFAFPTITPCGCVRVRPSYLLTQG